MKTQNRTDRFLFLGNHLCLDFINTRIIEYGQPVDLIEDFEDFVDWCAAAKIFSAEQADRMRAQWAGTHEAAEMLARALAFRDSLHQMTKQIARGKLAAQRSLDLINEVLAAHHSRIELKHTPHGYEKRQIAILSRPDHLLFPVAESAADLLSKVDLTLIKKCESTACTLYFHDTTKNHARSWCSMSACGNRAKAAAHYQRQREGG